MYNKQDKPGIFGQATRIWLKNVPDVKLMINKLSIHILHRLEIT